MKFHPVLAVLLLTSSVSWASGICDRTAEVQTALTKVLNKTCDQVTDADLATVQELDLTNPYVNNPGITNFQANDFAGLTSLQRLTIGRNAIADFPPGLFDGLSSLVNLEISGNHLTTLRAGWFNHLSSLETLNLSGEKNLTTVEPGSLNGLVSLKRLYLAFDALSSIPAGLLDATPRLRFLDLSSNKLESLPAGLLSPLTDLRYVSLQGKITDPNFFRGLTRLQELWGVEVDALPAGIFDDLESLDSVQIFSKTDAVDPALFRKNPLLTKIFLRVQAKTLPADLFSGLSYLIELEINDPALTSLPTEIFHGLNALLGLELEYCSSLIVQPGLFSEMQSLDYLGLREVSLKQLSSNLFDLPSLREINLSNAGVSTLDSNAFAGIPNLNKLDLSYNQISSLPAGVFSPLTGLRELHLEKNQLTTLDPNVFSTRSFASTAEVYVANNPLDAQTVTMLQTELGQRLHLSDQ